MENPDWLEQQLGDVDDDYVLFDCPGQIELYTHMTVMRQLVELLQQRWNFRVCGVFLVDSQFMVDGAKFLSGTMAALSVMVNLELPHINILTKMDLLSKSARNQLDRLVHYGEWLCLHLKHWGGCCFSIIPRLVVCRHGLTFQPGYWSL
jgi:GTPase SAR1 family protein